MTIDQQNVHGWRCTVQRKERNIVKNITAVTLDHPARAEEGSEAFCRALALQKMHSGEVFKWVGANLWRIYPEPNGDDQ